ncbi:MAG: hypothetical protein ACPG1A_12990 [Halioglobus sp.]
MAAEQAARAVLHELAATVTPSLELPVASRTCGIGDRRPECDSDTLARPGMLDVLGRRDIVYSIVRRYPSQLKGLPVREPETNVSSARMDRFALYELEVSVLPEEGRPSSASLVRGFLQRLPSGTDR